MNKYLVFVSDEWNNNYALGLYDHLKDSIPDINAHLSIYNTTINNLTEYSEVLNESVNDFIETPTEEYVEVKSFLLDDIKNYFIFIQNGVGEDIKIGSYNELSDSIPDINKFLEQYDTQIEDLRNYPSTFGWCFDKEIETQDGEFLMVRGFKLGDL